MPPLYVLATLQEQHSTEIQTDVTQAPPPDRRPIIICGPSGVGKGTLSQKLFDTHPDTFTLSVSHTTRQPRAGEVEGVTYFYVSRSKFTTLIARDAFIEHAFFSGNHYGASKQTVADQTAKGLVVVLDIEVSGVKQIKEKSSIDARFVFIKPPSFEALESRLRNRGTEKEEDIQKRLAQARVEIEYADTPGAFEKIIVNDDLEKAYGELDAFVYEAAS